MYRLRIPARDEGHADRICDAVLSALDPETTTAGMLETEKGWFAEGFYTEEPDLAALMSHLHRVMDDAQGLKPEVEALADRDWVRESLEAMPPVFAGRFAVFGHHDRHRIPADALGIEIEAAQAFGTGHHGTTKGCLLAIDDLLRARRFDTVLDIGTGTGVLAIALAKALQQPVLATDIDPIAVDVASENAAKNAVGELVHNLVADGVRDETVRLGAPYDLVTANILANPLIALAPDVAGLTMPGGAVVLSGLLTWQKREVAAAWRNAGFVESREIVIDGWVTLVLQAGGVD